MQYEIPFVQLTEHARNQGSIRLCRIRFFLYGNSFLRASVSLW